MPRGNGMGPLGEGPMTGRRMGKCVNPDMESSQENQNLKKLDRKIEIILNLEEGMQEDLAKETEWAEDVEEVLEDRSKKNRS